MRMSLIRLALPLAAVAFMISGTAAEVTPTDVVADRVIVRFEPMPKGDAERVHKSLPDVMHLRALLPPSRVRLADTGEDGPHQIYIAELAEGTDTVELARRISAMPEVRYAEPDCVVCLDETFPDDPDFDGLWGLHNTGQTGGLPGADIDAARAWDITTGSDNVVVAVIDTGVDYNHPDLAANMWVNPGESGAGKETDGIDNDGNGYVDDVYGYDFPFDDPDPSDANGHGTHVAGTIAAVGDNTTGVVGVNWTAKIMALRFLPAGR